MCRCGAPPFYTSCHVKILLPASSCRRDDLALLPVPEASPYRTRQTPCCCYIIRCHLTHNVYVPWEATTRQLFTQLWLVRGTLVDLVTWYLDILIFRMSYLSIAGQVMREIVLPGPVSSAGWLLSGWLTFRAVITLTTTSIVVLLCV